MNVSVCPSADQLHDYAVGRLSDELSESVAHHLDGCESCQASLATIDDADDTLISQLQLPVDRDPIVNEPQCDRAIERARDLAGDSPSGAREYDQATESRVGDQLGEYQLLEEIGCGGMGRVYRALQTKLDRVVALKVLTGSRTDDERAIARFEREMKAIGKLDHPNIVHAYDAREIEGKPVLVMEFVNGFDLGRVLQMCGKLQLADACELARQAALGLQYAHENDLVHRDVKPSNLILTPDGTVKLLDLGLARFQGNTPPGDEMTGVGQPMGTVDYMAPEQISDSRAVDIRADLYGLGCTLYKLLTGYAPFSGADQRGTFDKLNAHIHQSAPSIRQLDSRIPEDVSELLDRMLAKSPEDRPDTPADVAAALEPFCSGSDLVRLQSDVAERDRLRFAAAKPPLPVKPPTIQEGSPRLLSSGWWWGIVTGLLLFGAIGGFALGVIITIRRGDKETRIEVPDGSQVAVTESGDVEIETPATKQEPTTRDENLDAANRDLKAMEGVWKLVDRQGRSRFNSLVQTRKIDRDDPSSRLGTTAYLDFSSGRVRVRGDAELPATYAYQINAENSPKMIDFVVSNDDVKGVYELSGDRLKICLDWSGFRGPGEKSVRPTTVWAGLNANHELLVLERVGPIEKHPDEDAILGMWEVVSAVLNIDAEGSKSMQFAMPNHTVPRGTLEKGRRISIQSNRLTILAKQPDDEAPANLSRGWQIQPSSVDDRYEITLDPAEGRKHIAFSGGLGRPCRGVYRIEGDRLDICLQSVGRPADIDAATGDDQVVLHLKRVPGSSTTASDPGGRATDSTRSSLGTSEQPIIVQFRWVRLSLPSTKSVEPLVVRWRGRSRLVFPDVSISGIPAALKSLADRVSNKDLKAVIVFAPWDTPQDYLRDLNSVLTEHGFMCRDVSMKDETKPASHSLGWREWSKPCLLSVDRAGRFWLNNDSSNMLEGDEGFRTLREFVENESITHVELLVEAGTPSIHVNRLQQELSKIGIQGYTVRMTARKKEPARLDFRICATQATDELPGLSDEEIERYRDAIIETELREADGAPAPDYIWVKYAGELRADLITYTSLGKAHILVSTKPDQVMLSTDEGDRTWRIKEVTAARDNAGRLVIHVEFDEAGGRQLGELTQSNLRLPMAVIVDDTVIVAPTIRSKITNKVQITGTFEKNMLEAMVQSLAANIRPELESRSGTAPKTKSSPRK